MSRPIPFRWITGLPKRAQYEIERDFLELQNQLSGASVTIFDAIIDPTLSASNSSTHEYINLTEAIAGEGTRPDLGPLVIGVRNTGTTITETTSGPLVLQCTVVMVAFSGDQFAGGTTTSSRPIWDLHGCSVNDDNDGFDLAVYGLRIVNSVNAGPGYVYYTSGS